MINPRRFRASEETHELLSLVGDESPMATEDARSEFEPVRSCQPTSWQRCEKKIKRNNTNLHFTHHNK